MAKNHTKLTQVSLEQHHLNSRLLTDLPKLQFKINVTPQRVFRYLLWIVITLTVLSFIGKLNLYFLPDYPGRYDIAQIFDVDSENNIPTMYSSLSLLLCSILLAIIAYLKKSVGNRYTRHWIALSIIFLYLSADEIMTLHERTITPLRNQLNLKGIFYFAWVIPAGILLVIFLLAFFKFMLHLPAKIRNLFIIAGSTYIAGGLGVEMLGGYYANLYGEENIFYEIIVTIEECLEMLGIAIFLYALLSYLKLYIQQIRWDFNLTVNGKQIGETPS
ncbi:MAG TPA: hypothetical protein V6D28_22470 [Leptolyngbyaceae cyanobacterium]